MYRILDNWKIVKITLVVPVRPRFLTFDCLQYLGWFELILGEKKSSWLNFIEFGLYFIFKENYI